MRREIHIGTDSPPNLKSHTLKVWKKQRIEECLVNKKKIEILLNSMTVRVGCLRKIYIRR
jgi:hypothetical protein